MAPVSVCSPPPLDCQLLEGRRCVSLTCLYLGAPPFLAVWPQTGCLTSAVPSVKWEQRCLPLTHVTAAFRHSSAAAASQKTCGRNQIRHSFSTPRPGNLQERGSGRSWEGLSVLSGCTTAVRSHGEVRTGPWPAGLPFLPLSSLAADRGLGLRRGLAVPISRFSPGPRAGAALS